MRWTMTAALLGLLACDGAQTQAPLKDDDTEGSDADETDSSSEGTEGTEGTEGPVVCPEVTAKTRAAIVTDIDETLTTSDAEWLEQLAFFWDSPTMRPDADAVMRAYHDKGYRVFYVTARGNDSFLLDGTSAEDATYEWLDDYNYPYVESDVFFADGVGAIFDAADYKTEVLADLVGLGFDIHYAYGNADTDVEAYQAAGISDDDIFLVGKLAGEFGVTGIPDEEAYTSHLPWVEALPCAPEP